MAAVTLAKVRDSALRPELITGTWQLLSDSNHPIWSSSANLRLRCVGIPEVSSCSDVLCQNGGSCISDGAQNIRCSCPSGYRGPRCQFQIPACPQLGSWSKPYGGFYYALGSLEGSLATQFCPRGSRPVYGYSVCQRSNRRYSWSRHANCMQSVTNITASHWARWHRDARYSYTDENEEKDIFEHVEVWLLPVIVVVATVVPQLAPFVLYIAFICCCGYGRKTSKAKDDANENIAVAAMYKERLQRLRDRTPEPRNAAFINELRAIKQQLEAAVDELRAKRRQRDCQQRKTVSLWRLYSQYYYVSFWLWLVYMVVSLSANLPQYSTIFSVLAIIAVVFVVVLPCAFLIETCSSSERQYIKNLGLVTSAAERMESIRNTQPSVTMQAVCYHYETRYRTVYSNRRSRVKTYQERVVSSVIAEPFLFTDWCDCSENTLTDVRKAGVTKIKMRLTIEFADMQSQTYFYAVYKEFQQDNSHRDHFVNFSVLTFVDGFEERLAVYTDANNKPGWISSAWFWLATCTCLGWPYRIMFRRSTGKTDYNVVKVISVNSSSAADRLSRAHDKPTATETSSGDGSAIERSIEKRIDQLESGLLADDYEMPVRCAATDQHINITLNEAHHTPQPAHSMLADTITTSTL